jgi:cation-transporting ATPase 13A1
LSPVRPLTSIFHPALFVSLLGQFAIHFSTMILAVYTAKQHLPPDYEVELDGIFKPGILNTVVFLVSSVQQVTVFAVNLQGRPFMTGVTENTPLLWSLIATFILTFMFASETVPGLNRYFQLVSFPDEDFRDFILMILGIDLVASFTFDRTMRFVFAPKILAASFEGSSTKELFAVLKAFGMIGCMMYVFMGNSETWDELIEMEKNLTANFTMESMTDSVGDCVGEACDAIQQMANETASSILDEF